MKINRIIQIFLSMLIFVIIYSVFYFYFSENETKNKSDQSIILKKKISKSEKLNSIIEKLEYNSTDKKGNQYHLKSKTAKINLENQNIVLLIDVTAIINLIGKSPILIKSRYAEYNKSNYDTKFYDDVSVNYDNNKLNAKNLDLFFKENKAYMYNNILFVNNKSKLVADKVDFNLLSGDININMHGSNDKIRIYNK